MLWFNLVSSMLKKLSELISTFTLSKKIDRAQAAFVTAKKKFDELDQNIDALPAPMKVPTRLINIFTGEIEETHGDITKRYVISSYLWSPERFSNSSKDYSGLWNDIPSAPTFDEWFRLTCLMHPSIIQAVDAEEEELHRLHFPSTSPKGLLREYLEEVFFLLAREALFQGVKYVWIDCLCINQSDPDDVAREIPRMSDYYRNTTCCVAVSEALRRRFAPSEPPPKHDTEFESRSDQAWCRIIAWMKGYHSKRLWVFQETYLATKVVVRGNNVRIDATKMIQTSNSVSPAARNLLKSCTDQFPISHPVTNWDRPLSPELCLQYCRQRNTSFPHDYIYGIIGLFSRKIRHSFPVDYKLSPGITLAIFAYLRVRDGDLSALLTIHHESYVKEVPGLSISWLPGGFGWQPSDIFDVSPHAGLLPEVDSNGILHMSMFCLEVETVVESLNFSSIAVEHDDLNIEIHLRPNHAELFRQENTGILHIGGILEPSNSGRHPGVSGPPTPQQQIADKEREEKRRSLTLKAKEKPGAVVLATFGEQIWAYGGVPNWWFWLLLATDDDGKSWRRFGIALSHGINNKSMTRKKFNIH